MSEPDPGSPGADAGAPALALRGLDKSYPTHFGLRARAVLSGIELELPRGRTLGLAGPNGSGKTTLLRLSVGVERPTRGSVSVFGLAPSRAARRGGIGWLDEELPFPPEMSLAGALELMAALQGLGGRARRERCTSLLAQVGLAPAARTRVGRASRGMLRRLGLAQAWVHRPPLLILDEPTAGLDAQGFEVLAALLGEARERGTSVLIASHLASDLLRFCDELAVLLDGRVRVRGAPAQVLAGEGLLGHYRRAAAGPA